MRVVGIVGEPCVGKSSLMRALIARLEPGQPERFGLLHGRYHPASRVLILGDYGACAWPGTDAYDQRARAYAELLFRDGHEWLPPGVTVLWEGLLFADADLWALARAHDLTLIWLTASAAAIRARHGGRGTARPGWVSLLFERLAAWGGEYPLMRWSNETRLEQRLNLERLCLMLGVAGGPP